jgi:hypothetical protein
MKLETICQGPTRVRFLSARVPAVLVCLFVGYGVDDISREYLLYQVPATTLNNALISVP